MTISYTPYRPCRKSHYYLLNYPIKMPLPYFVPSFPPFPPTHPSPPLPSIPQFFYAKTLLPLLPKRSFAKQIRSQVPSSWAVPTSGSIQWDNSFRMRWSHAWAAGIVPGTPSVAGEQTASPSNQLWGSADLPVIDWQGTRWCGRRSTCWLWLKCLNYNIYIRTENAPGEWMDEKGKERRRVKDEKKW